MFNFDPNDPRQFGLMAAAMAAFEASKNPNWRAVGQAGRTGLMGHQATQAYNDRRKEEAQQAQMRQMEMAERQRVLGEQSQIRDIYSRNTLPGNLTQNDDMGNPMPAAPQGLNLDGLRAGLEAAGPAGMREAAAVIPQPARPKMAFAPNGQVVDMNALQPGTNYAKPDLPAGMRMGANGPEPVPGYIEMRQKIAAAGAPQVNTTTNVLPPREVFKDSMALKKDFDSQPEVKGFKEVQGAWDQISTALKDPSAANDLAAATKFMKLLDPGSVVRESELAMAMQATGSLDRFMNYGNRIMKGHKLTPSQRQEFHSAGEALYNASKARFGETVGQYEGIAKQYNLDPQFLPKEKAAPQKKTIKLGGKDVEVKIAPDGRGYVQMGGKWYEVQE